MAKTPAQRMREMRLRKKKAGRVEVRAWLRKDIAKKVREYIARLEAAERVRK